MRVRRVTAAMAKMASKISRTLPTGHSILDFGLRILDCGLGVGDWGLGVGGWGLGVEDRLGQQAGECGQVEGNQDGSFGKGAGQKQGNEEGQGGEQ